MNLSSTEFPVIDALHGFPVVDPHADLLESIRETLSIMLSRQLHLPIDQVQTSRPFTEYGLDSIAALTISGELEEKYEMELPPTLLWDCPTIDALALHMHRRLGGL